MRPLVSVLVYFAFATAIITAYFVVPAFLVYWGLRLSGIGDTEDE